MRFNVRLRCGVCPKQNVVSVFHVIHISHNKLINPVITDMIAKIQ